MVGMEVREKSVVMKAGMFGSLYLRRNPPSSLRTATRQEEGERDQISTQSFAATVL
jgi:hypothetical protein